MVSDAEIRAAVEHMLAESGIEAGAQAEAPVETPSGPVAAVAEVVEAAGEMAGGMVDSAKSMVAPQMAEAPETPAAEAPAAEAPAADLAEGKSVYAAACFVCHATGAAAAPLLGNQAQWAPRLAQGMDALNHNAINGKGAMPPKGGRMDLSDDAVRAAVAYMVSESR
jgi:cytochrome c5